MKSRNEGFDCITLKVEDSSEIISELATTSFPEVPKSPPQKSSSKTFFGPSKTFCCSFPQCEEQFTNQKKLIIHQETHQVNLRMLLDLDKKSLF